MDVQKRRWRCRSVFFLGIRRPPRSTRFPYTSLVRSGDLTLRLDPTEIEEARWLTRDELRSGTGPQALPPAASIARHIIEDRKSTRLNSSHANISYAVLCLQTKRYVCYHFAAPSRPLS